MRLPNDPCQFFVFRSPARSSLNFFSLDARFRLLNPASPFVLRLKRSVCVFCVPNTAPRVPPPTNFPPQRSRLPLLLTTLRRPHIRAYRRGLPLRVAPQLISQPFSPLTEPSPPPRAAFPQGLCDTFNSWCCVFIPLSPWMQTPQA